MSVTFSTLVSSNLDITDAAYQTPGTYGLPVGFGSDSVSAIAVTGTNTNYTDVPVLTVADPSGGHSLVATAYAVLAATGVNTITVDTAGTGYFGTAPVPTFTSANGPGSGATATSTLKVVTATLVGGGSAYTANDVVTVVDDANSAHTTTAQITIDTVDGDGVVLTSHVSRAGVYSIATASASNPVSVSGGTGTLATFTLAWGVNTITRTASGTGYTARPLVAIPGGTATAHPVLVATGIDHVVVSNGGGTYTSAPSITDSLSGNATLTATIGGTAINGLLTVVEIMRAYIAAMASSSEMKRAQMTLFRMLSEMRAGSTFNATTAAADAQAAAMRFLAQHLGSQLNSFTLPHK